MWVFGLMWGGNIPFVIAPSRGLTSDLRHVMPYDFFSGPLRGRLRKGCLTFRDFFVILNL